MTTEAKNQSILADLSDKKIESKGKKNNPKSLLLGIKTIRKWCDCPNTDQLSIRVIKKGHTGKGYSGEAWRKIESDQQKITYQQMQALADVSGVPVGVFFMITHVISLMKDGETEDLKKYLHGIAAIAQETERHLKVIPDDDEQEKIFEKLFKTWKNFGLDVSIPEQNNSYQFSDENIDGLESITETH